MKNKIASFLVRILASTWRYIIVGEEPEIKGVVAFWHGSMLAVWKYFSKKNCVGITSMSKDGDILATLLNDWKYEVIRGSSSRGGKEVLTQMIQQASERRVLITPDGPRGPAYQFKAGAVICAQQSHTQLVFCECSYSASYTFKKSWDAFRVPLPFSRITLRFHEGIRIAADASREEIDALIQSLNQQFNPRNS